MQFHEGRIALIILVIDFANVKNGIFSCRQAFHLKIDEILEDGMNRSVNHIHVRKFADCSVVHISNHTVFIQLYDRVRVAFRNGSQSARVQGGLLENFQGFNHFRDFIHAVGLGEFEFKVPRSQIGHPLGNKTDRF